MLHNAAQIGAIFGPIFIVMSVWIFFHMNKLDAIVVSMRASPGLIYLSAFFTLLIGTSILSMYRAWDLHLALLVTLLGWLSFIKGVMLLFYPEKLFLLSEKFMQPKILTISAIVYFFWGIGLLALPFIV